MRITKFYRVVNAWELYKIGFKGRMNYCGEWREFEVTKVYGWGVEVTSKNESFRPVLEITWTHIRYKISYKEIRALYIPSFGDKINSPLRGYMWECYETHPDNHKTFFAFWLRYAPKLRKEFDSLPKEQKAKYQV